MANIFYPIICVTSIAAYLKNHRKKLFILQHFFFFIYTTMAGIKSEANKNGVPLFKNKITKLDEQLDKEIVYEFGGPLGALGMMLGFPCLMYYFWVCLEYYQGTLITPTSYTKEGLVEFVSLIVTKVKTGAAPTPVAIKIYMGFVVYSAICAYFMPGPVVQGLPLPSLKGNTISIRKKNTKKILIERFGIAQVSL